MRAPACPSAAQLHCDKLTIMAAMCILLTVSSMVFTFSAGREPLTSTPLKGATLLQCLLVLPTMCTNDHTCSTAQMTMHTFHV
jgi:hypothetical protein